VLPGGSEPRLRTRGGNRAAVSEVLRRVGGYNLDEFTDRSSRSPRENHGRFRGDAGIVLEAKLRLVLCRRRRP